MVINLTARKTIVKDTFKEKAEKKLAKLERFFEEDVTANITVTNEQERETVEVTLSSRGMMFRAEKTTSDRLESLDGVVDILFKQIVKNKSRLEKRLKATAFEGGFEPEVDIEQDEIKIVKSKKFPLKPMTPEEAVLQMKLIGHQFYMFFNGETEEVNVVYQRKDGNFGLIEPSEDDEED